MKYLLSNGKIVYPTKEQWDIICYETTVDKLGVDEKVRYVKELKFKKQFPFFYINKRPETTIERIQRQYDILSNLLPVVLFIGAIVKLIEIFNEKN